MINVLLPAFKEARLADPKFQQLDLPLADCGGYSKHGHTMAIHSVTTEAFMNKMIQVPKVDHPISVLESAEKRMGEASAVLADLWLTALKLSKVSNNDIDSLCPQTDFDTEYAGKEFRETVIKRYPDITHHKPLSDFDKYASRANLDTAEDEVGGDLDGDQKQDQREPNSVKTQKKK